MSKKAYNPESTEIKHKVVGGNPSGIANFSKPSRLIYKTIYMGMLDRTWFPAQVDLSNEPKALMKLSDAEVRMYEFMFGKLIFNDSVITNRIMDNLNGYVTDPIVNACFARQGYEESEHSLSYAYIGDDVIQKASGDPDKIYELHRTDPVLKKLAKEINDDYSMFDTEGEPTFEELSLACIANLSLEGISFPAGFLGVWSLGSTMIGSASMVTEISKDELGSHLPLYVNLYNHIKQDTGVNADDKAVKMLTRATEREIEFLNYSTQGVLGFTEVGIRNFMEWICNSRCRELGFELPYKVANTNDGLIKIFKSYSDLNETKTNFFEGTVKNYSKEKITMDF